jgi:hypothetical protein
MGSGAAAGRRAQFCHHGRDVMIDGPGGQDQLGADLGVAVPGADEVEHLTLARRGPGEQIAGLSG